MLYVFRHKCCISLKEPVVNKVPTNVMLNIRYIFRYEVGILKL